MKPKLLIYLFAILLFFGCDKIKQETLIEYSSDAGRFSVKMPGNPKRDKNSLQTAVGTIVMYSFSVEKADIAYVVAYIDYPGSVIEKVDPDQLLDNARNGALQKAGGNLLSEKNIDYNGYSARELEFEVKGGLGLGRAVHLLADNRLYQVMVIGLKLTFPTETVQEFINSFEMWD